MHCNEALAVAIPHCSMYGTDEGCPKEEPVYHINHSRDISAATDTAIDSATAQLLMSVGNTSSITCPFTLQERGTVRMDDLVLLVCVTMPSTAKPV